jgi:hypothetical protein
MQSDSDRSLHSKQGTSSEYLFIYKLVTVTIISMCNVLYYISALGASTRYDANYTHPHIVKVFGLECMLGFTKIIYECSMLRGYSMQHAQIRFTPSFPSFFFVYHYLEVVLHTRCRLDCLKSNQGISS